LAHSVTYVTFLKKKCINRRRDLLNLLFNSSAVWFAVARHFLYTVVERNVTDENEASLMRARQRGAMRRFVLNVHQVRAFVFLLWTH